MPLDASFIGRIYPPSEPYGVGRERIREFATAIGADDPAYHDPKAAAELGHPDVIAPPTFPILITNEVAQPLLTDPALGLDFSRVVHGDQRFAYIRPIRAGDRIVCVVTVEDITSRAGMDFLSSRTELSTDTGEPIGTAWSRLIVRGES
jgi:acyl dehydratase